MKKVENLIVVAHPDDEAIWFSSILKKPNTALVFCFQNKYLLDPKILNYTTNIFKIIELYKINLRIPVIWLQTIRTLKPRIFGKIDTMTKYHLENNLFSLISIIKPKKIYTHNPWGEYGHSEHIFVHKIMKELRDGIIFPSSFIVFDKGIIKKIKEDRNFCDSKIDIGRKKESYSNILERYRVELVDISFRNMLLGWYKKLEIGVAIKYFEEYFQKQRGQNEEKFIRYKQK